jgi:hypothetical protein
VLDITGSMDSTLPNDTRKKITGLIEAARLFVNEVKDIDDRNQVSIGIVPYNTQVNLGQALRAKYNATNLPVVGGVANSNVPNVNCLEPPTTAADFAATGISTTAPIPMSVHADMTGGTSTSGSYVAWNNTSNATLTPWTTVVGPESYMCAANAFSEVLLPTMNKTAMLDKINSLKPGGRTSIMMGMRWGVALLDETARPIYSDLRSGEAAMAGRPANNNNADTRKIIVLMTDGAHVATSIMRDPYKSGMSPIYRSADGNYSIFHDRTGNLDYWVPHRSEWRAQPWSNTTNNGTFAQLDWSVVWQNVRVSWVAQQLYVRPGIRSYSAQMNLFRSATYVDVATMNTRLQANCAAAKASGFEVYGIAFGAGTAGETQIRGCASAKGSDPNDKTGYYFKPQTSAELAVVFRDIASQVSKLRLTQ